MPVLLKPPPDSAVFVHINNMVLAANRLFQSTPIYYDLIFRNNIELSAVFRV